MVHKLAMVWGNLRSVILNVFIILFMMKAMIPLGFMPNFDHSSAQAITICSGVNEVQIFVNDNGEKIPAPQNTDDHKQSPCDFSIAAVYTSADSLPTTDYQHFAIGFEYPVTFAQSPRIIHNHSFQSQAPPALV